MNEITVTFISIYSRKVKNYSKSCQNTEDEMALIFFFLSDRSIAYHLKKIVLKSLCKIKQNVLQLENA